LQIDAASYSTGTLIASSFKTVSLLPTAQQVRTLISDQLRQDAQSRIASIVTITPSHLSASRGNFERRLLRWSVLTCEELQRSQRSLADPSEMEESRFTVQSSELLVFFRDYLHSIDLDTSFEAVTLNLEELTSSDWSEEGKSITTEDFYRTARVNVTLIHHLWTLYMRQFASEHTFQNEELHLQAPAAAGSKLDQTDLKQQLERLESYSTRAEHSLSELLSRNCGPSTIHRNHHDYLNWHWQLPYVGATDIRILFAFLFGIVLGSALKQQR
jgi:hypothetical protein